MNIYKVAVVIVMYSLIGLGGCISVNVLRGKKGKPYTKTKVKAKAKEGSLIARDLLSGTDSEVSALPYIALPPGNVLPDDEKKKTSMSKLENKDPLTKQQIPVTAIPLAFTATVPSTVRIPYSNLPVPTTTPHTTTHPTPQPVNINLVLPTMPPFVQKPSMPPSSHPNGDESNVTKIDLSLNIGEEEHQKQKPVVIQLPPTSPPVVGEVVSQIQKAREINSQLSLLASTPLQKASFWNTPSAAASMLGIRNPYSPVSIEEMVSQNRYPYGYPPESVPPNLLPFQGIQGLISKLQQGLARPTNPLIDPLNAIQPAPVSYLSSLLSNAIKSSLTQSQPDLITSALTQAALQVQAQKQPPQLLTSALTQAIAKVVGQNTEPSEEQKLIEILGAALNLARAPKSLTTFLPMLPTPSSLKVEIVHPTTSAFNPIDQVLKQAKFTGPGEQQIISLNVSPLLPQQTSGSIPAVVPQQNHGGIPPVLPQSNPANAPPVHQPNVQAVLTQPSVANAPLVLPQSNPANAPVPLPQMQVLPPVNSPANAPPITQMQVLPPVYSPANAPPISQSQVLPSLNSPANAPPLLPNTGSASPVSPQMPIQQASYNAPILDQITANALGKAMAKTLVHTAKKIVYNNPATQRDKIISRNNMVHYPRRLQNFIRTTFFPSSANSDPYFRTFLPNAGFHAFWPPFGPFKMKYLRHRCFCFC